MINNRQAGRRRGRGGNGGGGGGGGQRPGGQGGNGSRIDNRARGNATQLHEKYKNMAADAQRQGDRVNTEYYLQFADHYFRVLSEQRGRFEEQPRARRDEFDGDGEFGGGEFADEGEPARGGDGWADGGDQANGQRFDRDDRGERGGRDDRPRGEARDDRQREGQRDGQRGEGYRRDANGEAREQGREQGRDQGRGEGRQRGEWQDRDTRRQRQPDAPVAAPATPVEVAGQRRAEPMGPGETLESRAEEVLEADRPLEAPAARRRGRPRRDPAPMVLDEKNDAEPVTFEADRLPPSLTVAANDEAAEVKPRRRRARVVEDTPDAAE